MAVHALKVLAFVAFVSKNAPKSYHFVSNDSLEHIQVLLLLFTQEN